MDGACYSIQPKDPAFVSTYDARSTCRSFGGDIADIPNERVYEAALSIARRRYPVVRSLALHPWGAGTKGEIPLLIL